MANEAVSSDGPEPGDVAPMIDLTAHDGRHWRLRDHLGTGVVLIFHRHLA